MLNDNGRASPDHPEEDGSIHESLTMEQFDSPLVGSPYKATYAAVINTGERLKFIITKRDEWKKQKITILMRILYFGE